LEKRFWLLTLVLRRRNSGLCGTWTKDIQVWDSGHFRGQREKLLLFSSKWECFVDHEAMTFTGGPRPADGDACGTDRLLPCLGGPRIYISSKPSGWSDACLALTPTAARSPGTGGRYCLSALRRPGWVDSGEDRHPDNYNLVTAPKLNANISSCHSTQEVPLIIVYLHTTLYY
jgi:hypothetical protein